MENDQKGFNWRYFLLFFGLVMNFHRLIFSDVNSVPHFVGPQADDGPSDGSPVSGEVSTLEPLEQPSWSSPGCIPLGDPG